MLGSSHTQAMLPPGLPLHPALQTVFYATRPIEFLELCERRYGDAFKIHTLMFGEEACFSHPDVVKQIFTADPEVFRAGEANAPLEPLLGPRKRALARRGRAPSASGAS